MTFGGIDLVLDPGMSGGILAYIALGIAMGTCSGLIPGLHANNFALFLASIAPALPGPPLYIGCAMIAAGVVHTFLDAIPALAIGVPDAEMAVAALPGHRMVLEGRGREALQLSAVGSAFAVLLAIPLAVPITLAMVRWYPLLRQHMPLVLGTVAVVLLVTEPTRRAVAGALLSLVVSSILGFLILDVEPSAPLDGGGVLAPLFAGMFGTPVILDAMQGGGIPRQLDSTIQLPRRGVAIPAAAGSVSGAIVGYLPGVSSAIAAVVALLIVPSRDPDRDFIVATSGVDTANAIFAIFALVALGTPRTGIMVAVDQAAVPLNLPIMVISVAIAAGVSFVFVSVIGGWYLEMIGRVDYRWICMGILVMLVFLSYLFAGFIGLGVFVISSIIGFIPVRIGGKRVHLMGCLMGPIVYWTWNY